VIPTKAVVLAHDGSDACEFLGSGGRSHGQLPATALLPIGNHPLLGHALDWIAEAGLESAVVIVPEAIAASARELVDRPADQLTLHWLEQLPGESFAHILTAVAGFLEGEPFVFHLADSLARPGLRSVLEDGDADGGDRADPRRDLDALMLVEEPVRLESDRVIDLQRRSQTTHPPLGARHGAPAGVVIMGAATLPALGAIEPSRRLGLEALAAAIVNSGGSVQTRTVRDWWRFRGDAATLLEGNRLALERLQPDFDDAVLINSDLQGAVAVHATASIESSIVRGPVVVGAGARVRDAYVGPYTSIGDGAVIEGAETEHSIVFAGATISHVGGRLEASLVGRDARIWRDFKLPRALRLQVGDGARVSLG